MNKRYVEKICIMITLFALGSVLIFTHTYAADKKIPAKPAEKAAQPAATKPAVKAQPQYGGNLRIVRMTGPGSPFGVPWETIGLDTAAATPVLEKLMRSYPDRRFEPWLVTTYKLAPDLKSITLSLRKDVKFHDGTPLNAEAVKFNLEAYKTAKRAGTDTWASIEALDDLTVRVNFIKYRNTVIDDLMTLFIASPESIKTKGLEWARWNPVGTGPFEFVSFERDVRSRYKKFAGYWQKGKPYLDTVEYLYVKDPMTQLAMMEAGEADLQSVVLGKVTADMQKMGFEIIQSPSGTMSLIPDSANPDSPLANTKVREAIAHAIDREAYVKALGYGFLKFAYQIPMQSNMAYVPDLKAPRYDVQKAKRLLVEAGYPNGIKIKIIPMPGTEKDFMVALQGYLAKVGITADLEPVDMGKYMDYRRKGWKNGFLMQPFLVYPNFTRTMELYFPSTGPDLVSLKRTAGLDKMVEDAAVTPQPEVARLRNIVKAMNDDMMVIPIYLTGAGYATKKGVFDTGFLSLAGAQDWTPEKAWIKK
jgi:peptide/nickel transport system substrate-binding protein